MKTITSLLALAALAGCSHAGIEAVPGSITYGGQPQTKLTRAPVGSTVTNRLSDAHGQPFEETYIIQQDRSLKLVSRRSIDYPGS